jgi:OOP family OmpA-OmpF porin
MRKLLPVLALALAFIAPVQAGNFYVGGGFGQTSLEAGSSGTRFDVDDTGFKGFIGFEFFKFFALEASYTDFGSFDDTVLGNTIRADASAGSLYGVGILPLGRLRFYGKAGYARWDTKGTITIPPSPALAFDEDGTDFTYGIGVDFRILRKLIIRLEFETYDFGDTQDVKFGSLGVEYKFGH